MAESFVPVCPCDDTNNDRSRSQFVLGPGVELDFLELDYVEWRLGDIGDSPYVKVGWPAGGGVWVLSTTYNEASERGVAKSHNAYHMDERCKALEQLGAIFHENPRDCHDLDLP